MFATGAHRVRLVLDEIEELYSSYEISHDLIGLRNLAHVAELMIVPAMARTESRVLHYPQTLPEAVDTILAPPTYVG